jgi:tripartite-type tricarboxylate transporter receptor subunit TctC
VALVTHAPNVLIVTKKLPAQNIQELIALAKKEPGKLSFASAGAGSSLHMAGELFNYLAQVNMVHVPYKGSTPAMADLMGGHIEMMFDNLPTAIAQIKANNVRALGITGPTRIAALPDVPTIAEAGIPGFSVSSYFALFTPTGTPVAVIKAINAATNQALAMPDLQEKFAQQGASPAPGTPEDLGNLTTSEIKKWGAVLKAANIKFD